MRLPSVDGFLVAAITALFLLAFGTGAGFFVDHQVERVLVRDTLESLSTTQDTLADIYEDEDISELVSTINRLSRLNRDPDAIFWLANANGEILVTNLAVPLDPSAKKSGVHSFDLKSVDGDLVHVNSLTRALPGGYVLMVGRSSEANTALQSSLRNVLLVGLAVIAMGAIGLGVGLERVLRHRVDLIARTALGITGGDLSQRVRVTGRGDEFDRLAHVLNTMLARVESQVLAMRTVTDSLAHDMRLPLTRIRAGIEQAVLAKTDEDRHDALDHAFTGADVALSTFNTLLEIARADSGVGREAFDQVVLEDVCSDVVEFFSPLAEDNGQSLVLDLPKYPLEPILGQSALLRQALGNLVHNAIKYAGAKATIVVKLSRSEAAFSISVKDDGPGIGVDEYQRALQPFGRLQQDGIVDGTGLGLALAGATARLHGGTLSLSDAQPGLLVTIDLPSVHRA